MECPKAAAVAGEDDEGRRMVASELEAAKALAEMAHFSTALGGGASNLVELRRQQRSVESVVTSQDQLEALEPATIASREKAENIVKHIPTQLCSSSRPSNPPMKFKQKLTEAEKEERKIRRVMANRESARQTIRRRQAMLLELTRKADDVLEENENLKKQKELMMEEYNSLKGRNDFLKAQLAGAKNSTVGEAEEAQNSSEAERLCPASASTQAFLHNQPSMVPAFWPYIIPSSDVFPFQCTSHMNNSQILMPPGDTHAPCLHQAQENSVGNPTPGAPLFVVPVPWLLPLLTHRSSGGTQTHHCGKCSCSEANPGDNSNHAPSNLSMRAEAYNQMETVYADSDGRGGTGRDQCSERQPPSTIIVPGMFSPVRPREASEPSRSCQEDDSADLRHVSVLETMRNGLFRTNQERVVCSSKKAEEMFVATAARRRRKELMKLRNIHCK